MLRKRTSQIVQEKTRLFAKNVVLLFRHMKKHRVSTIATQFLRSGTSIGANIAEGRYAQSPSDALAKYYIAQKEAAETLYWLELFKDSGALAGAKEFSNLHEDCKELLNLLDHLIFLAKAAKSRKKAALLKERSARRGRKNLSPKKSVKSKKPKKG